MTWETSEKIGVGLDFSIGTFLSATVDYFNNSVDDLIFSRRVGPSVGYASITVNDGALLNNGVEFDLNFHLMEKEDFKLDLRVIGASNINELTRMPIDPATGEEKLINDTGTLRKQKDALYVISIFVNGQV